MKYKYNLKNLDCANCAKTIENKLNEDKNIKKPIRDGYTFSSWAVIYYDGYEIPSISEGKNHMNENKLLKANWTDNNSSD